MDLKKYIRNIPDFPQKGILFRDITPLLADGDAFKFAVKELANHFKDKGIQKVAGVEARGFIIGAPVAAELGVGFVPIRKPGKLPFETVRKEYQLEYGMSILEVHKDAVKKGEKVLMIDDLLATGGTAKAASELIESLGGEIAGWGFVIVLKSLKGEEKLKNYELFSLIDFD
ncbi:MAG: adenine phosphoribosyltransferase [Caldisericaceae bacterium]|jgi:adenine phosphoribosyltransferase|nr:adenine phosphoribosyltransferase [Caldisericaceae bacterium]